MYPNFSMLTISALKNELDIKFGLSKYLTKDELNFLFNLFLNEFSLDFPEYKAVIITETKAEEIAIKYDSTLNIYLLPIHLLNDNTDIPPIEVVGYIPLFKYQSILFSILPSTKAYYVYDYTKQLVNNTSVSGIPAITEVFLLKYLDSLIFNKSYINFANKDQVYIPEQNSYVYCITLSNSDLPVILFIKVPRLLYQDWNKPLQPKIYRILEYFLSWKFLELLTSKNIDLGLSRLSEFTSKIQDVYYNQLASMTDETTLISSVSLGDISVSFKSSLNEINQTGNLLSNLLQAPIKLSSTIAKEFEKAKQKYERLYKKSKYWYYLGNT